MAGGGSIPLDVMLNLSWGTFTRGREFQRELDKTVHEAVSHGTRRGVEDGVKGGFGNSGGGGGSVIKDYAKQLGMLIKARLRSSGEELAKTYEAVERRRKAAQREAATYQSALEKSADENQKKKLRELKKDALNRAAAERSQQKALLAQAEKDANRVLDLRKDHEEKLASYREGKGKEFGEDFSELIENAFSLDNIDAKGLAKGLGGALSGALKSGAGSAAAAGKSGTTVAALATAATSITAIVAPLAAVVGLLAAAYGNTKELNKSLLEGASSADLLGDTATSAKVLGVEYSGLNIKLKQLRSVTIDAAYEFRMSKEEVAGYISTLGDAGLTVREFRGIVSGATTDVQAYENVTRTAILATTGLGISSSDTAQVLNRFSRDFGSDLTDIQGAFGMIFAEAKNAGMSAKDFFAAINQASSGMALYNFRVEDTVGLFTDLVKILGEDLAKEQLGLQGTFSGMGMQDKFKTSMLGGQGMQKAAVADARKQAEELAKKFGEKGKTGAMGDLIKDGTFDIKALANMTGEKFREALAKAEDPTLKRQLVTLQRASKATKGTMGVAQSMGSQSKAGELGMMMEMASTMSGGKSMDEMEGVTRMMFEEVSGFSGEQFDNIARIQTGMLAELEARKATGEIGKDVGLGEAVAGGLLSQSEELKEAADHQYSMMERAAQEQLMETRSMSQTISNVIAGLLENIWLGVEHLIGSIEQLIPSFLRKSSKDRDARNASFEKERQLSLEQEKLGGEIIAKKGELTAATDPAERVAKKKELALLQEKALEQRKAIEAEREFRKNQVLNVKDPSMMEKFSAVADAKLGQGAGGILTDKMSLTNPENIAGALGASPLTSKMVGMAAGALGGGEDPQSKLLETIAEQDKDGEKLADGRTEEQVKATEESAKAITQTLTKLGRDQLTAELMSLLEAGGASTEQAQMALMTAAQGGGVDSLRGLLASSEGGISVQEATLVKALGLEGIAASPTPKDFIYRGDGTSKGSITPLHSMDDFYGAMPGGAIDNALRQGSGGGGGGKAPVTIQINGGDEGRVYSVVKRVLRESGYGDMKRY